MGWLRWFKSIQALMGLSAVESLFLGRAASKITGYTPSAYQRQSGLCMLSAALTALIVWLAGWGLQAAAAVLSMTLVFFGLSACNHAWSAFKEGNCGLQNLMRPVLTALLIGFAVPFIVRALNAG